MISNEKKRRIFWAFVYLLPLIVFIIGYSFKHPESIVTWFFGQCTLGACINPTIAIVSTALVLLVLKYFFPSTKEPDEENISLPEPVLTSRKRIGYVVFFIFWAIPITWLVLPLFNIDNIIVFGSPLILLLSGVFAIIGFVSIIIVFVQSRRAWNSS